MPSDPEPSLLTIKVVRRAQVESGADAAPPPLETGEVRYERGRELGRGGTGVVYEAVDRQFERRVAVKELLGDPVEVFQEQFAAEALITGSLEHPGVPSVYERGVTKQGRPFYSMRLVRGRTLADAVQSAGSMQERLELISVVIQAAHTVAYAHERGVVHRDIKPHNVIVGEHGDSVVIDWGIAVHSDVRGAAHRSEDASVVGTPAYLAPEQAEGGAIDARTDVFALGAMLYFVLSGRAPYRGRTLEETITLARAAQPEALEQLVPEAPARLRQICAKAMSRLPEVRYRTAGELAAALQRFTAGAIADAPSVVVHRTVHTIITLLVFFLAATIAGTIGANWKLFSQSPTYSSREFIPIVVLGFLSSGVEWVTRGRYQLQPVTLACAIGTVLVAVMRPAYGLLHLLDQLQGASATGSWIAVAPELRHALISFMLACKLSALQLLLWAAVRRALTLRERITRNASAA